MLKPLEELLLELEELELEELLEDELEEELDELEDELELDDEDDDPAPPQAPSVNIEATTIGARTNLFNSRRKPD